MLEICDLHVQYDAFQALMGVSLKIKEGEIVALLGSNGAGKTTTIKAVSGTVCQTRGKILFDGKDISPLSPNERASLGIVQVPEGRRLFPFMSVYDNLLVGSYLKKCRANRSKNLERCWSFFPKLYERRTQMAGSLSGGEQQMCAIARGLMQEPRLLMLDEPSLGLAPIIVEDVFRVIQEINRQGVTILLVEQNVLATLQICSEGYVIETGQNAFHGSREELLESDAIKEAYIGVV